MQPLYSGRVKVGDRLRHGTVLRKAAARPTWCGGTGVACFYMTCLGVFFCGSADGACALCLGHGEENAFLPARNAGARPWHLGVESTRGWSVEFFLCLVVEKSFATGTAV